MKCIISGVPWSEGAGSGVHADGDYQWKARQVESAEIFPQILRCGPHTATLFSRSWGKAQGLTTTRPAIILWSTCSAPGSQALMSSPQQLASCRLNGLLEGPEEASSASGWGPPFRQQPLFLPAKILKCSFRKSPVSLNLISLPL